MKVSDFIKKLESLKEKHGDNELVFSVQDHFSNHGQRMCTDLKCGEETNLPSDWSDVYSNGAGVTEVCFKLQKKDEKYSKITYRK